MKIARDQVVILWEDYQVENKTLVHNVVVAEKDSIAAKHDIFDNDIGANCDGWLSDKQLTPEAVVGQLMARGFKDNNSMYDALNKIKNIEGCDWAEAMLPGVLLILNEG